MLLPRILVALAACLALAEAAAELRVVPPLADEVVHRISGTAPIVVTGSPPGSRLLPLLDGQVLSDLRAAPAYELHGVNRGTRTLEVVTADAAGTEGTHTRPASFHVFGASRLLPQRRAP